MHDNKCINCSNQTKYKFLISVCQHDQGTIKFGKIN